MLHSSALVTTIGTLRNLTTPPTVPTDSTVDENGMRSTNLCQSVDRDWFSFTRVRYPHPVHNPLRYKIGSYRCHVCGAARSFAGPAFGLFRCL